MGNLKSLRKQVNKSRKKGKNIVYDIIIIILLVVIGISGYQIYDFTRSQKQIDEGVDEIKEIVQSNLGDFEISKRFSKQAFDALKSTNEDMVGYLDFDNGLISIPVVQSYDNNYYLRKNFNREYSDLGIPFMDCNSTVIDDNIVIYGHNSAYSETTMFSPLRKLLDQSVFNENDTYKIYYEDEVRSYQIIAMYWYTLVEDEAPEHEYTASGWYTENAFNQYFNWVESRNLIHANTNYNYGDKFVTFQTCKSWDSEKRLVVIAKQISNDKY